MVAALLTFVVLLLSACSGTTIEPCTLACGDGGACPDGASCGPDGFCKGDGDGSLCGEGAGGAGTGGSGTGGTGTGGTGTGGTGTGGTGTGGTGTGGTGTGGDGGQATGACVRDLDCLATERCEGGRCLDDGPADCPRGAVSTAGGCVCVDGWQDAAGGGCEPVEVKLAVGGRHTCAFHSGLLNQWELVCWGDPALAIGAPPGQQTFVEGFGQGLDLAAGLGHVCAIDRDGALFCWGDNAFGQAGQPSSATPIAAPARVEGRDYVAVTAGDRHTCALRADGTAWCFGDDSAAQLGRGGGSASATPVPAAQTQRFRSLAAGRAHTCGVTTQGALWCWSTDPASSAAIGGRSESPGTPGRASVEEDLVKVAAGGDRTCAIFADGKLRCMGAGPLGDGLQTPSSSLVRVREPDGTAAFLDVAVGTRHACGQLRSTSGASLLVACWGDNALGAAASGANLLALAPELHGNATAIGAGWDNSCVENHGFECSGNNRWGQLGGRNVGEALLPTRAGIGGADWTLTSLTLGPRGGCGLEADGALACWGRNEHGQHYNGSIGSPQTPNEIFPSGSTSVALGDGFTCVGGRSQNGNGAISCWGRDDRGQLGDGTIDAAPRANPGFVAGAPGSRFLESALAAGRDAVVVSDTGTPRVEWRWGAGLPTPSATPGVIGLPKLTANGDVYCGLDGGAPVCRRFSGGDVAVPAGQLFAELSRGARHLCGVRPDGTVACTGDNADGQLGADAPVAHANDWVNVPLPGAARLVVAGEAHTCALAGTPGTPGSEGVAWCWGRNDRGQLGTGDLRGRTAPASVDEGRRFTFVAAGPDFTCAIDVPGDPWCWGNNDHDELGNGHGLAVRFEAVQP